MNRTMQLLEATKGVRELLFNRLQHEKTADAIAQGVDLFAAQNKMCDPIAGRMRTGYAPLRVGKHDTSASILLDEDAMPN